MKFIYPVFTIGRSGSSMVAGVMSCLGIDMGRGIEIASSAFNPKGFYEDLQLGNLHKQMMARINGTFIKMTADQGEEIASMSPDYRIAIEARNDRSDMWGMKDPRFCFFGRAFLMHVRELGEARVVVAFRQPQAQNLSAVNFNLLSRSENYQSREIFELNRNMWNQHRTIMDEYVHPNNIKTFIVDYDHAVENPRELVEKFATWVYDGTGKSASSEQIEAAVEMIDPKLRHFS